MHYSPARRVAGLLTMALLAACSGGGGGDASTRTVISTNAIGFNAVVTDATVPTSQVFTATFGSDIAHLAVVHSGAAVGNVTSTMNGRTATITVQAGTPGTLGPGTFNGAVAVTGYTCADATCSKLAAGATSTVSVSYQVSPVVQLVTPYADTAGVADEVVIRGLGLTSFNVQGVRFGDVAATAFTVVAGSTTEIRATHPELPAGSYPVRLVASNHQGDIPTTATLTVVDPVTYAATTLAYPEGGNVRGLLYDSERRALLVVTDAGGGSIVRYPYTGSAWGAPASLTAGFWNAALSTKGTSLYAVTSSSLWVMDPATIVGNMAPVPAANLTAEAVLRNIVVGNDDVALITTAISASTSTSVYFYFPLSNTLVQSGTALNNATPAMAANGSGAYLIQGDFTLTADVQAAKYTTASNSISSAVTSLRQNHIAPVISRTATRLVLNGTRVYDATEAFLGTLPGSTAAVALKSDGSRTYAYDPVAGGILVYDTSVDRDEAAYAPLGAAVPLAGDPGNSPKMILSPDGRTLFLAGSTQVVVQPTPAL